MARRIDYLNDPNAPKANSIVPSVNIAVRDDTGRLLLICRSDNGNWALPGGAVDVGERLTEAGVRETLEETGIRCAITGLVGIYTDPGHVIHYTGRPGCCGRPHPQQRIHPRALGGTGPDRPLSDPPIHAAADHPRPRRPHHPLPRVRRRASPPLILRP